MSLTIFLAAVCFDSPRFSQWRRNVLVNQEILQKAGEDELTRIVAPIILWVLMSCSAVIGRGFGHIEVFIPKPVPWLTEVDTALKVPFAAGGRCCVASVTATFRISEVARVAVGTFGVLFCVALSNEFAVLDFQDRGR